MVSFDRAFYAYRETLDKLKSLKAPVQITDGKKKYELSMAKGELSVKSIWSSAPADIQLSYVKARLGGLVREL